MRKNNKQGFLYKFILALNCFAIIALFLSYLATVISPAKIWILAFFGLAYPFILLSNIIFIIFWLFKIPKYALISAISILIGYSSLSSTIGFNLKSNESLTQDSSAIKLMTYNIHFFKGQGESLDSNTRIGILNFIKNEQPDIVGFQEFMTRKKGKYDIKDSITTILDTKYHYFKPATDNGFESYGLAIFSKLPIVNKGVVEFNDPTTGNSIIWADVKKDEKIFRIFLVHLESIYFRPEDYNYFNKLKSNLTFDEDVNSGKRIIKKLKTAFIKRSKQVEILKTHTDSCKTPYIIMGDFNDTPVSYTVNTLSNELKNTFQEKGSGLAITYNGDFPNFQIDYILASSHFKIKNYNIVKKPFSDHYPVISKVSLQD